MPFEQAPTADSAASKNRPRIPDAASKRMESPTIKEPPRDAMGRRIPQAFDTVTLPDYGEARGFVMEPPDEATGKMLKDRGLVRVMINDGADIRTVDVYADSVNFVEEDRRAA